MLSSSSAPQDQQSFASVASSSISPNDSLQNSTSSPSYPKDLSYLILEAPTQTWLGAPVNIKQITRNYSLYTSRIGGVPVYPHDWYDINDDAELVKKLPFLAETLKTPQQGKQQSIQVGNSSEQQKTAQQKLNIKTNPACPLCKCSMKFIAQLFAPLGDWDRFVYVWACCEDACAKKLSPTDVNSQRKRWKAYRLQTLYEGSDDQQEDDAPEREETENGTTPQVDAKELQENFQKSTQEWTLDSGANTEANDLDDEIAKLLADKANVAPSVAPPTTEKKPTQKKSQKVRAPKGALPCYKLDIFEEPTEDDWIEDNPDSQAARIARDYKEKNKPLPNQTEFTDDSAEVYEDEAISLNLGPDPTKKVKLDKQFLNFQIALEKCPDQSVRWEWKGKPLWASSKFLPGNMEDNLRAYATTREKNEILSMSIPPCAVCKNPRSFEFQILPTVIYQLFGRHVDGIDFGSVFVFTCSSSCAPTNRDEAFLQECYVHVQPPMD